MIVITMLPIKATIAFIIILAFSVTTTTTVAAATVTTYPHQKEHSIPTFSISDLRRLSLLSNNNNNNNNKNDKIARIDEFREALSTTGLLAVRLDDDDDYGPQDNSNNNNNNNNNMEEYYSRDRRIALDGLCSCIDHPEFLKLDQTHELILSKSTTKRTSVATATVGLDHPLPLPNGLEETCGVEIVSAMEGLRDVVATVSKVFISAVDTTIILGGDSSKKSTTTTLLRDEQRGKSYKSITDIVSAANHLEHFHVYTNNQEKEDDGKAKRETAHTDDDDNDNNNRNSNNNNNNVAWDWHTDAGLFLVFVPAWDCNNNNGNDNSIDESFYYRDGRDGTPIRAKFDGGRTAIVMLGQGAQDWLNLPSSSSSSSSSVESKKQAPLLKATSHSVRWDDDDNNNSNNNNNDKSSSSYFMEQQQQQSQSQRRAWYGMMHLVPETAMIYGAKTLREVKQTLSLSHQNKNDYQPSSSHSDIDIDIDTGVSLGCGNVLSSSSSLVSLQDEEDYFVGGQQPNTNSRISRRRLSEHQDPSMCNNVTNFFCWMTCMDVPKPGQAELYIDAGYSLYCLDEAVLAKTGNLSAAYEPCIERHDMACKGEWEKTVEGVPAANINVTSNPSDVVYPFCYGGTTMYMEGFQWIQSSTCVVLLFPSWVLNSSWKYILAVIATFLCALGLEKFIQQRRKVMAYMESGTYRLFVSALFYGIQLSVGYLLMLIIMIYSFVLFMAVILGLVSGHILFNAKDAIWPIHESLNLDEIDAALDSNSDNNDDSDNRDETVADSFAGNGSNGSNGSNGDINSHRNEKSSFRNSTFSSSSATKVQMNLLANASEERALGEGSTHCQEFDDNEYYGSMDEIKDEEKAFVSAATASKLKKEQTKNNKAKRNSNHDVPEGSTPCCQQGM